MKPDYRNFLQKTQIFLILALGTVPVPMILFGMFAGQLLPYVWVLLALYVLLALLSLKVPGRLRIAYGIVGMLLMMIPGLFVPVKPLGTREVVLAISAFYGVFLMLSLQVAGWPLNQELPVQYVGYCLVPHLLGQFIVTFDSVREAVWSQIAPWMTGALFLFLGLAMLSMNRTSVKEATGKRQGISAAVRGKNILLTLALFAVALLTSLIPSVLSDVLSVVGWISDLTGKLFFLFDPELNLDATLPLESTTATTMEEMSYIPTKPGNPVAANITFIVMMAIAVIILIPLVVLALIRIWKALRRLGRGFWRWFQGILSNASEEYYEDEITDTREELEVEATKRKRSERFRAAFVNEQKLTAEQRIRHRYRRLAAKHQEWRAGNTARENLPEQAAELYERARYSDHPISEEDAAKFKSETKGI